MTDPLINPKDPLRQQDDQAKQLFRAMQQLCINRPLEHAINAAVNVLVNAIRQGYPVRSMAEARYDELFGRMKTILLSHYDANTGKRRSVFAFDQIIAPPLHIEKDAIRTPGGGNNRDR